jgi:alpha-beta hydrolase superfamily lysophospholipase
MLEAQDAVFRRAGELNEPLLVMIGDEDPVADPAAAQEFFDRAGSPDKTCIHYPGFLHELLRETERVRVFEDVLAWIRSRVPDWEG